MDKQDRNFFENFQHIKGDERKKDKLYKKMIHLSETGDLPEKPQRFFLKFLTPAIVLALFFIMIPFLVNNEQLTADKQKEEEKEPIMEITERDDWYYGEGANWYGYINIKAAEGWVRKDVKEHSAWSESTGELTFKGENPEEIKYVKYEIDGKNGKSGGTTKFDRPFEGTIDMGYGAGNSYTREDAAIKVTIEWDGKKEVIPFTQNPNISTTKKIERTKEVSKIKPFVKDPDQFIPPKFLVAGDGNFQLGASTWDPIIAKIKSVAPYLEQWNESQNVLLMFKDLTNISKKVTIKGKHGSDEEQILYEVPNFLNAVESFKEYDWVIPANISFNKDGIWTLTAYEGDKKVGTVTIDVQRTKPSLVPTPLFEDEMIRGLHAGIFSSIENINGTPTLFLGETNSQKVFWKFFGVNPDDVIVQGLHESGTADFTKTLEEVYKSDKKDEYEMVDGVTLEKEGLWNIRFYSNEQFLGEVNINAERYK